MKKAAKPETLNAGVRDRNDAAQPDRVGRVEIQLAQAQAQAQALAAAMPFNAMKPQEIGRAAAVSPPRGATPRVEAPAASASTLSAINRSTKTGDGPPSAGRSASPGSLDAVRSDAAVQPLTNNKRDGLHRQAIPRGRVAYEPNSLGGGCPFQAGAAGFVSFAQPLAAEGGDKLRGKPEKFADHYTQATLFYESQTAVEQAHIVGGFRFELSKLTVPAIRERMLSSLLNVSPHLSAAVAQGLGVPVPPAMPKVLARPPKPEVTHSAALRAAGATAHLIVPRLGLVEPVNGQPFEATGTLENAAPVLFDGLVLPDSAAGVKRLAMHVEVMDFISNQYRHGKTILAIGASSALLEQGGVRPKLADGEGDPGIVAGTLAKADHAVDAFIKALGRHRHPEREAGAVAT